MLGSVDRSHVMGLIDALTRSDGAAVVAISEGLRLNGLSAASALEDMSMVLQRMAVLQAVPSAAAESDDPDHQEMLRLSEAMPADETQLLYSLCLHGRTELGLAPDEYAALTMVLLRLLAFKPKAHQAQEVRQVQAPVAQKKTLATAPPSAAAAQPATSAPAPLAVGKPAVELPASDTRTAPIQVKNLPVRQASEPTERTAPKVLVVTEEGHFWAQTVRQLVASEAVTALVRELALQSQLIARDTDQWHLRIDSESLNQGTARERLQAALNSAGYAVKLVVEIGKVTDSPAQRNAADLAEKQKAAEDLIHSDPMVQAMVENFGAKIVPGTIKLIS
jgi:DNA polymerase-3 subunit gamma/tau